MMELLQDTNIWVLISFVIFVTLAFKFGQGSVKGMLDDKIESISKEVEQAESMRVEAQELLAQYQRKTRDADKEAEEIIARAKSNAKKLQKDAKVKLDEELKRREAQLQSRLALMEEKAIEDIRNHATNLTLRATSEIIASAMNKTENARLADEMASELSSKSVH